MTRISMLSAETLQGRTAFAAMLRMVRGVAFKRPGRDMFVAALLLLSAPTLVHAEDRLQDWVPDVLAMPEDAELVTERAIGSSIRLFTISTAEDVDALFAAWEESLRKNGYEIVQGEDEILDRSIEFSGSGITNAKIILSPATDEDRSLIEFDATLD